MVGTLAPQRPSARRASQRGSRARVGLACSGVRRPAIVCVALTRDAPEQYAQTLTGRGAAAISAESRHGCQRGLDHTDARNP